jgi:hypothetical protein
VVRNLISLALRLPLVAPSVTQFFSDDCASSMGRFMERFDLQRKRSARASEAAGLIEEFLAATASMPAQAAGRACGVDGQTIQNLRAGRIHTIRRSTRQKLQTFLQHRHDHIPK